MKNKSKPILGYKSFFLIQGSIDYHLDALEKIRREICNLLDKENKGMVVHDNLMKHYYEITSAREEIVRLYENQFKKK